MPGREWGELTTYHIHRAHVGHVCAQTCIEEGNAKVSNLKVRERK